MRTIKEVDREQEFTRSVALTLTPFEFWVVKFFIRGEWLVLFLKEKLEKKSHGDGSYTQVSCVLASSF